jgi:Fe-S cluster assembly protein SufD
VKCSHGATTGQIDENALFYLRSRGVPEALARNLLIQSFIAEALEEISDEKVREAITGLVVDWLPAECFLADEWVQA